jgi:hypothetical protein
MRRTGAALALLLLFGLGACGGGGDDGPDEAFCDALDTLSEQIEDGDDIDEQIDTIEDDLGDSAEEGEQRDAVEEVAEAYEDSDNDQADLAEEVQDELGDFAEECGIDDDEFAIAPTTTTTTTTEPPETTTTTEPPDDTTLPPEDNGPEVLARAAVPGDIAPEYVDLANACFNGDMEACDTLYDMTPGGSSDEAYGATCAGRIAPEEVQVSECATIITGPLAVPADVVDQAAAQACFGGDMVACDTLFQSSEAGSIDEAYGALCGVRVQNTNAFCVDIFGDVAFL